MLMASAGGTHRPHDKVSHPGADKRPRRPRPHRRGRLASGRHIARHPHHHTVHRDGTHHRKGCAIEDFATRNRIYNAERRRRLRAAAAAGLLDISKVEATTPEQLALISIIHDVKSARLQIGLQDVVLNHLANIERNARIALTEGARP